MSWGSPVEVETKRRINVALWAYAYELRDDSIVADDTFDRECEKVDLTIDTGNELLDTWFKENFEPFTGSWIHTHPELDKIEQIYEKYYV